MSAKVDVFMPFFVKDYLAATADLSIEEHGAYSMLLFHLWDKDGSLPFDHDRLARLCRMSRKRWEFTWEAIARFFVVDVERCTFSQKRVTEELEKAKERKAAASENGAKGAKARWQTNGQAMATPLATPVATPMANGMAKNDSSPAPLPSEKDPPLPPRGFEEFWEAYPKKKSKDDAIRAWRKKKPPLADVLAALAWQTKSHDWTKDGGAYIPYPASYLNGGGWKDEPTHEPVSSLFDVPRLTR